MMMFKTRGHARRLAASATEVATARLNKALRAIQDTGGQAVYRLRVDAGDTTIHDNNGIIDR